MALTLEQFGLDRLSFEERMEVLELIWDSLSVPTPPIPEWHWPELERRIASADEHPEAGVPWDEFRNRWLCPA